MSFINQLSGNLKNEKRILLLKNNSNIWAIDLADMQLIRKYNKGIRYLLCIQHTMKGNPLLLKDLLEL